MTIKLLEPTAPGASDADAPTYFLYPMDITVADIRRRDDARGMLNIPPELVIKYQGALAALQVAQDLLLAYVATTDQHVPYGFEGHTPALPGFDDATYLQSVNVDVLCDDDEEYDDDPGLPEELSDACAEDVVAGLESIFEDDAAMAELSLATVIDLSNDPHFYEDVAAVGYCANSDQCVLEAHDASVPHQDSAGMTYGNGHAPAVPADYVGTDDRDLTLAEELGRGAGDEEGSDEGSSLAYKRGYEAGYNGEFLLSTAEAYDDAVAGYKAGKSAQVVDSRGDVLDVSGMEAVLAAREAEAAKVDATPIRGRRGGSALARFLEGPTVPDMPNAPYDDGATPTNASSITEDDSVKEWFHDDADSTPQVLGVDTVATRVPKAAGILRRRAARKAS